MGAGAVSSLRLLYLRLGAEITDLFFTVLETGKFKIKVIWFLGFWMANFLLLSSPGVSLVCERGHSDLSLSLLTRTLIPA